MAHGAEAGHNYNKILWKYLIRLLLAQLDR